MMDAELFNMRHAALLAFSAGTLRLASNLLHVAHFNVELSPPRMLEIRLRSQ